MEAHAQAGALIGGAGIAALLGKGLEYRIQKLLAHTDAGIGNDPAIGSNAVVLRQCLYNGGDLSAGAVILNAVAVNVQEDLAQMEGAAVDIRIGNM